jgi:hypothetical protein
MIVIAFGYRKRSGKDTAAKFLDTLLRCERTDLKICRAAFADKLKDICFQLFNWAGLQRGQFYEEHPEFKEVILQKLNKTPRQIWIEVGNYLRDVYPMTWIDYVLHGVRGDVVITSDLRFRNEAAKLRAVGAKLIKIEAQERLIASGVKPGTDPAEIELDGWQDWDFYISNNGTQKELYEAIEDLAKRLHLIK